MAQPPIAQHVSSNDAVGRSATDETQPSTSAEVALATNESAILRLSDQLKAMNTTQSKILELLGSMSPPTPANVHHLAKELLLGKNRVSSKSGSSDNAELLQPESADHRFFDAILPCGKTQFLGVRSEDVNRCDQYAPQLCQYHHVQNIEAAETSFAAWISRPPFPSWKPRLHFGDNNWNQEPQDFQECQQICKCWPHRWDLSKREGVDWRLDVIYPALENLDSAVEQPPFRTEDKGDELQAQSPEYWKETTVGVFCGLTVTKFIGGIDFKTLAAIYCIDQSVSSKPRLLEYHFGPWSERYVDSRDGSRNLLAISWAKGSSRRVDYSFVMRSFTPVTSNKTSETTKVVGMSYQRETMNLNDWSGGVIRLREARYSTTLRMDTSRLPIGNFLLFSIVDAEISTKSAWRSSPGHPKEWQRGIASAGVFTGIAALQIELYSLITCWSLNWNTTMDAIDEVVSIPLKSLEDDAQFKPLMYDNARRRTELYFQVLQVLRKFAENVRAATDDLDDFSRMDGPQYEAHSNSAGSVKDALNILEHNWNIVRSYQERSSRRILDRIERTEKAVESRSSGLFNAQSIEEARKGTQMNQMMLSFTFVTIIFLPPSFVATFFGLEFFHAPSDLQTRRLFWIVLVLVTVITLVLFLQITFPEALHMLVKSLHGSSRQWIQYFRAKGNDDEGDSLSEGPRLHPRTSPRSRISDLEDQGSGVTQSQGTKKDTDQ